MSAYLQELTIRLATAMGNVPEDVRQRHANWVWTKQNGDGGWAGREGNSDPYYTSFALRTLAVTGELYGSRAESAAGFLRSRLDKQETVVDLAALIYGASLLENAAGIDVLRKSGYNGRIPSPTFLRHYDETMVDTQRVRAVMSAAPITRFWFYSAVS